MQAEHIVPKFGPDYEKPIADVIFQRDDFEIWGTGDVILKAYE